MESAREMQHWDTAAPQPRSPHQGHAQGVAGKNLKKRHRHRHQGPMTYDF